MKHFADEYRPEWKNIKCHNHHGNIRRPPNICPWCLLRRVLKTVQKTDEYHLDERTKTIKEEIENLFFDSNIGITSPSTQTGVPPAG